MLKETNPADAKTFQNIFKSSSESESLLRSAMEFLCLSFGFNSGLAIIISRSESKSFCALRHPDGKTEYSHSKFTADKLEFPNWGAFASPKTISVIEDFETQSILTRQCRKFAQTQELMDKITANVAKTPSVFIPLYDEENKASGFFHVFREKRGSSDKPVEFGARDEILLTLFKGAIEKAFADRLKEATFETLKLQSRHQDENNKSIQKELDDLRKNYSKRMEESHRQGMNNIAVGILHNIGNVMNSISVSNTVVNTTVSKLKVELLERIAKLLAEHKDHLDDFTKNDEVGRDLIEFIAKVANDFSLKRDLLQKEITVVIGHLEHVQSLIASQQAAARLGGVVDAHALPDLVEEAVSLCLPRRDEEEISVTFDFGPVPLVVVDKHKLLQILVNFLTNARNALLISGKRRKHIEVSIARKAPNNVLIKVKDNGVGIPIHNQQHIFAQGFSTRKDGNGIGLHNCAIAAQEMRGKIWCESQGTDLGATFFIELPLTNSNVMQTPGGASD